MGNNILGNLLHWLGSQFVAQAPTTPDKPGEKEFVQDNLKKNPTGPSPQEWDQTYRNAVSGPGFSGQYYQHPSHAIAQYFPKAYQSSQQVQGTETTQPNENQLTSQIQKGFLKFNPNDPAATLSAYFAQAGQGLPDPYLPAVLALKETGGGMHMANANNFLNIAPGTNYPSPQSNIIGGEGHKGFSGVIHSGLYDKYLKSGNMADFFPTYTPTFDNKGNQINDSQAKQIQDANMLESYFTGQTP